MKEKRLRIRRIEFKDLYEIIIDTYRKDVEKYLVFLKFSLL